MLVEDVGLIELRFVRSRFASVVADWRLTLGEVRGLLGLPLDEGMTEVLPARLDVATETRMRLVIDLERGLSAIMTDDEAAAWMRAPSRFYDGLSPMQAASGEIAWLRGLRNVLATARDGQ